MRIITVIFLLIHGLIHFMGFAKGYDLARLEQLKKPVSKGYGTVWLVVAVVFLLSLLVFVLQRDWWWIPVLLGIIGSQFLVIRFWQDAKFGTVANVIILFLTLVGFGQWSFSQMVRSERMDLWDRATAASEKVNSGRISTLPPLVQRWLTYAGADEGDIAHAVCLQQEGRMRTSATGRWMKLQAEEWFTTRPPGFIWTVRVCSNSLIQLRGRDSLVQSRGKMLIKLYSLIPVVRATGPEIDQGALVRYLSEIIWFPSAALLDYIRWETAGEGRVRAIIQSGGLTASGIFDINPRGQVVRFEAQRYYHRKEGATLETWVADIDPESYQTFGLYTIPTRASLTWKLKSGDFNWLHLTVTGVECPPAE
jgi:hypothetical protein